MIVSVDLATVVAALADRRHEDLVDNLAAGLQRLARAGASVAGLAANSVHAVFEPLAARSPLRLVSIVEATAAARSGFRTLGLMGARFTTAGDFYAPVFERAGMTVRAPSEPDRDWIHDAYMNELVAGGVPLLDTTQIHVEALLDVIGEKETP